MSIKKFIFFLAVLLVAFLQTELGAQTARMITTTGVVYVRSISGSLTISGTSTATSFVAAAAGNHSWTGRSIITSPADAQINLTNAAATSGVGLDIATDGRLIVRNRAQNADGAVTAFTYRASGNISMGSNIILLSATAPTISSGFGTSPSVPSNNGTGAFTVNVGTGGTATGGVLTMPAATTGWNCTVTNRTAVAANRANQWTVQTAATTTTVTVQNQTISTGAALAWTASDVLHLACFAY